MKLLLKFFFLLLLLGIFSCQESKTVSTENKEIQKTDSIGINLSEEDAIDEELRTTIKEAKEKIKDLIKENENKKIAEYNYKYKSKVTNSDLHIEIEYGNIFTQNDIHSILHVHALYATLVCVYYYDSTAKSDSLKTLLYLDRYHNTYQGDTIKDANGDNKKDFIIQSYPMSGCCLAELRDVYLFQTATKFTEKHHFINPTFYPKEKIIRGLTYGWNPLLYKYKWNGLQIDTVEYISPNITDSTRSTFFKTKKWENPSDMENVNKIKLKSIPKEYHSIENFDVFQRK